MNHMIKILKGTDSTLSPMVLLYFFLIVEYPRIVCSLK